MYFKVMREFTNQEIRIPVQTGRLGTRIVVRASHPTKPNTVYFNTAPIIKGDETFIIRIPKMPESVIIEIYNDRAGHQQYDKSFKVNPKNITSKAISLPFMIKTIMDPRVGRFANFSDEFCENAALYALKNGIFTIISDQGEFRIDYVDVIRDENGRELRTPARVNDATKIIQIARKYYLQYTVPGRKAINWHEFSHVFKNKRSDDEFEADKNAITIYLGQGNPIIEAYNVFLNVFNNTPSDMNTRRYDELNKFIRNFSAIMTKRLGIKTTVTQ